jgi:3-mercaptopyruvate sulfurtransferase SseA
MVTISKTRYSLYEIRSIYNLRLIFVSLPLKAQAPMTVSAEWLKDNIKNPKLVLLHVGQRKEYDAGHIAGAMYVFAGRHLSSGKSRTDSRLNCRQPSD